MLNIKYYLLDINTGKLLWISAIQPNSRKIFLLLVGCFFTVYVNFPQRNMFI